LLKKIDPHFRARVQSSIFVVNISSSGLYL